MIDLISQTISALTTFPERSNYTSSNDYALAVETWLNQEQTFNGELITVRSQLNTTLGQINTEIDNINTDVASATASAQSASESEKACAGYAGTLTEGAINDSVTGTSSTWSSIKIESEIASSAVTVDTVPIEGSNNPVSSDGMFDALALKADKFNYLTKTSTYTAVKNDFIYADTTTAFTVTLPSSPSANDEIGFLDLKGLFSTNNLTIARNGKNIMGLAEDMTVSTKNISFVLIYTTTNEGWRLK